MNKSLKTKEPFALRSPLHGLVALFVMAIVEGWQLLLAIGLVLVMSTQSQAGELTDEVAYARACQEAVASVNTLEIELLPITFKEGIRRASVAELSRERWGMTHRTAGVVLGHTVAAWRMETEIGVRGLQHSTEQSYCYKPMVKITLGYKPIEISVGSEVQSQCALDYIVEHEKEHVRLYVVNLPVIAEAVRAQVAPLLKLATAPDQSQAYALVMPSLDDKVGELVQREVDRLAAKHATFDKEDAHHMAQHSCFGEIQAIARAARQRM